MPISGYCRAIRILAVIAAASIMTGFGALPNADSPATACTDSIKVRIGTLDPGFGVSPADLQSAIQQAGDLWGSAAHRRLFEYDPSAELAINLVYDERQESTKAYIEARDKIRETSEQAATALNELKPLQARLKTEEQIYASQQASLNRGLNAETAAGIRLAINEQLASIQKRKLALDRLKTDINARVEKYNSLIELSNARLAGLTDRGAMGIELIAGHYAEEDGTKRIDIFQFKDRTDLLLVLAHELGQALGMQHNTDPQSIMAPLIVTKEMALSPRDLADFMAILGPGHCGDPKT